MQGRHDTGQKDVSGAWLVGMAMPRDTVLPYPIFLAGPAALLAWGPRRACCLPQLWMMRYW